MTVPESSSEPSPMIAQRAAALQAGAVAQQHRRLDDAVLLDRHIHPDADAVLARVPRQVAPHRVFQDGEIEVEVRLEAVEAGEWRIAAQQAPPAPQEDAVASVIPGGAGCQVLQQLPGGGDPRHDRPAEDDGVALVQERGMTAAEPAEARAEGLAAVPDLQWPVRCAQLQLPPEPVVGRVVHYPHLAGIEHRAQVEQMDGEGLPRQRQRAEAPSREELPAPFEIAGVWEDDRVHQ